MSDTSFTGRARRRSTSRGVKFADKASKALITGGGIGTILAVAAICVFLVYVVIPLFQGSEASSPRRLPAAAGTERVRILHMTVDEYGHMTWLLGSDGVIRLYRMDDWILLHEARPFGDALPTAWAFDLVSDFAAFGFEDGRIRLARIGFEQEFLSDVNPPEALRDLEIGQVRSWEAGVVERTPEGQLRHQVFYAELEDPVQRDSRSKVVLLDLSVTDRGPIFCALGEDDLLSLYRVRKRKNLMTGKTTVKLVPSRIPYEPPVGIGHPRHLRLSALGDVAYVVWEDGRLLRYYRSPEDGTWSLAEDLDLVEETHAKVTALEFLVGKASLAVGDSTGRLRVWFRARSEEGQTAFRTADGFRFVAGHRLSEGGAAVTALGASPRSRLLAGGRQDGTVDVYYVTARTHLVESRMEPGPVQEVVLSPRQDMLLVAGPGLFQSWAFEEGHPEVTLASLFAPVWYEGHSKAEHVWQSTGATNEFEQKLGVMPLVYGTLKATLYSLLFGVPIAILAALFTSEFLSPRVKVPIKSTIEVMASLPSVVLGFIAAMVIAPFVQDRVPSVLTTFLTIPASFLIGAYVWQMLPQAWSLRLQGWPRFFSMACMLVVGVAWAGAMGPWIEDHLYWVAADQVDSSFSAVETEDGGKEMRTEIALANPGIAQVLGDRARGEIRDPWIQVHDGRWGTIYEEGRDYAFVERGAGPGGTWVLTRPPGSRIEDHAPVSIGVNRHGDIVAWLDQPSRGPATGGWVFLTLPLCAVVGVILMGRVGRPWLRRVSQDWGRLGCATADFTRFAAGSLAVVLVAWGLGALLHSMGLDARGGVVGTYVQRNAMVVGFVMGFAIIPIIYTLAEDALSSVPSHLREGSLGAGATQWQTATRIIMPTAMSGLFSAVMIGLGRAVGETMIVLMAAGNTPVMEANIFNGFRTLSANIAVELPEAVVGDSHYRTLFLTALVLFAMTFVVNTVAEAVRQRFRKRAFQL